MTGARVTGTWTPMILCVAPNGARKTKADHPALPISPDDLAETARRCRDAGAAMMHLHVRDDEERHCLDVDRYRAAIERIRDAVGDSLVLQVTTEAVGCYRADEQMAVVRELGPEAVSLAVRELVTCEADEPLAGAFFQSLAEAGTLVQYILYSAADLERFFALKAKGVIPAAHRSVLYVLGRYSAGQRSEPAELLPFLSVPGGQDLCWSYCAFNEGEGRTVPLALSLGGHARVGFENNLLLNDGLPAPDNAALVAQAAGIARAAGRPLADAAAVRALMA
ncbi:MAG: 3-keto-5-aminohexanoate cleavage protein [Rhodospirillales bacterium]